MGGALATDWDIRGWKSLTVHDDPPLVAARKEFLAWLEEVPEPHKSDLDSRLKSKLDHSHFPARLELFTHHEFTTAGWRPQIHPDLPNTNNHPDFMMKRDDIDLIVECRTVMELKDPARQDHMLRELANNVSRGLDRTVMLEPLGDLPDSLPAARIRRDISRSVSD